MEKTNKLEQMGKEVLKDPLVEPKSDILENILGKNYKLYTNFLEKIYKQGLIPEWKYYNDTKSWLCRILNKKKNYCWLSVIDKGFKCTIFFTQDTINGIFEMDINENIKEMTKENRICRKNPPVIMVVKNKSSLNDTIKILKYKLNLK